MSEPTVPPAALRFEHLLVIDDPADPRIAPLGPARLWRGLVLRMEYPQNFQPALERCDIERLADGRWLRTLHFGAQQVRDRVSFSAPDAIDVEVLGGPGGVRAHLRMQVEAARGGQLRLRFLYLVQSPDHDPADPLSGYIRDAYRQADEETVFRIRQLAASGVLDEQ